MLTVSMIFQMRNATSVLYTELYGDAFHTVKRKDIQILKRKIKMIYTKNCVVCGVEFHTNKSFKTTCSEECARERGRTASRNRRRRIGAEIKKEKANNKKPCIVCGNLFVPFRSDSITCSPECNAERKRQTSLDYRRKQKLITVTRKCVRCGKEFETNKASIQKVCGSDCLVKRQAKAGSYSFDYSSYRKTKQPKVSIAEISVKARAKGMTYGKYVAEYGNGE